MLLNVVRTAVVVAAFFLTAAAGSAQAPPPSPAPAAPVAPAAAAPPAGAAASAAAAAVAGAPAAYATFIKDAVVQPGLITIIKKAGRVYLALTNEQLGKDFIETSVPSTGLGGIGPAPGEPYVAPARILHFDRVDDTIVLRWPNTISQTNANTPEELGARISLPGSTLGVVPIAAQGDGKVVILASVFLGDVANLAASFERVSRGNPASTYRLDPTRSFFERAKALPENDILRVSQTWTSASPPARVDNAPDPRSIEVVMTYNIIAAPHDGYMPRFSDPRVGYFEQPRIDFSSDVNPTRTVFYTLRWNFAPATPGQPSKATKPLVYYISNTVPLAYRDAVKSALLSWNDAFKRIGILDAVQVEQQPDDPNWDPEDIRHNMFRWINTSAPAFGAEGLLVVDPRTGEVLNTGVNFDAVVGLAGRIYRYVVAPARGLQSSAAAEKDFAVELIRAVTLHESGHGIGLQHNFIASRAYTAQQLQSKSFTSANGISSSVMDYTPTNLWPKGTPQGTFQQDVLGPYDYYAVQYGYGYIKASTPTQELPTLQRWASRWADPKYRFASDEDAQFGSGHSVDPRVMQDVLTNKPLDWCAVQADMMHSVMDAVANRFPSPGQSFEDARRAFSGPLNYYIRCAVMPAHIIGGEYLSRANRGDPGAPAPLTPVARADEAYAMQWLNKRLFSDAAWRFNPKVLRTLTYNERSAFADGAWVYNPTARHDLAIVQVANAAQDSALAEMFAPLRLQRIDDLGLKYPAGSTMTIGDLFQWTRDGIFGDILTGAIAKAGPVRRNLQTSFAKRLADMWVSPRPGTPPDAQALARLELGYLQHNANLGLRGKLDDLTRGHLQALATIASQALNARRTIPPSVPAFNFGGFGG
ncbi:MAG: zinc-dependent metalloprotease [Candidatus Eremiobacteraeota bacterium]|nr:zinc-dependent metalloprotease [Candidatus Eremiobacteraeota bacterium]